MIKQIWSKVFGHLVCFQRNNNPVHKARQKCFSQVSVEEIHCPDLNPARLDGSSTESQTLSHSIMGINGSKSLQQVSTADGGTETERLEAFIPAD